jgi:transglutaminase-like putative cysteine protease
VAVLGGLFARYRNYRRQLGGAAVLLLVISVFFFRGPGIFALLETAAAAVFVFAASFLIFLPSRGERSLFILEPAALGVLYFRMITFTRSSQETMAQSSTLTVILPLLWIATFVIYLLILYSAGFGSFKFSGFIKEAGILGGILTVLLLVITFLPADFSLHDIVENIFGEEARKDPVPLDVSGPGIPGGNLQNDRGQEGNGDTGSIPGGMGLEGLMGELFGRQGQDGTEPGSSNLQGMDPSQWSRMMSQGRGEGEQKQYAVMVVASKQKRLYMGSRYYSVLDPERGFLEDTEDPLNRLSERTLMTTWTASDIPFDRGRNQVKYSVWSAEKPRYIPFTPVRIEPTVFKENYDPFLYAYNGTSYYSDYAELKSYFVRQLSLEETEQFGRYLAVPLEDNDYELFREFTTEHIDEAADTLTVIEHIMKSFSDYQYEIGFTEDVRIPALKRFLLETKSGDCTEFSNVAALAGRMAGIPSRVVTGFLASRDLQMPPHLEGLIYLQKQMDEIAGIPLAELFLVTTMHRHSWVQFYVPPYGWVDFEATMYAIPPEADMNPNAAKVVIPLLDRLETYPVREPFRWDIAGIVLLITAGGLILAGYAALAGKYLYLSMASKSATRSGVSAAAKLLLFRMRRNGCAEKKPGMTLKEYAAQYGELSPPAELHSLLLYSGSLPKEDWQTYWREFIRKSRELPRKYRRKGILELIKRIFSYRGLFR